MTRADHIRDLFPRPVVVEEDAPSRWERPPEGNDTVLFREEVKAIERAVPKRKREFTAGRVCARRALSRFGVSPGALPPKPDRSPPWPEGFVGSITHTRDWCGVVVTRAEELAGVGIDAEPEEPIETELFRRICTSRELEWLAGHPEELRGLLGRAVFSAKEAFYKAQYLQTSQYLGFHDVELDLDWDTGVFRAVFQTDSGTRFHRGDGIEGRIALLDGLIVSVAWL